MNGGTAEHETGNLLGEPPPVAVIGRRVEPVWIGF
jgi:hypothetical protein